MTYFNCWSYSWKWSYSIFQGNIAKTINLSDFVQRPCFRSQTVKHVTSGTHVSIKNNRIEENLCKKLFIRSIALFDIYLRATFYLTSKMCLRHFWPSIFCLLSIYILSLEQYLASDPEQQKALRARRPTQQHTLFSPIFTFTMAEIAGSYLVQSLTFIVADSMRWTLARYLCWTKLMWAAISHGRKIRTRILIRIVSHRLHLLGLDIVFEIHQWKVDDKYCNVLVVFWN